MTRVSSPTLVKKEIIIDYTRDGRARGYSELENHDSDNDFSDEDSLS
jgi:hypothetical protein